MAADRELLTLAAEKSAEKSGADPANESIGSKLSREANLLVDAVPSGFVNRAKQAYENPGQTSLEFGAAVAVGASLSLLDNAGGRYAVAAKIGRTALVVGFGADLVNRGYNTGAAMKDAWSDPNNYEQSKAIIGQNLGGALFDYPLMAAGGMLGGKIAQFRPGFGSSVTADSMLSSSPGQGNLPKLGSHNFEPGKGPFSKAAGISDREVSQLLGLDKAPGKPGPADFKAAEKFRLPTERFPGTEARNGGFADRNIDWRSRGGFAERKFDFSAYEPRIFQSIEIRRSSTPVILPTSLDSTFDVKQELSKAVEVPSQMPEAEMFLRALNEYRTESRDFGGRGSIEARYEKRSRDYYSGGGQDYDWKRSESRDYHEGAAEKMGTAHDIRKILEKAQVPGLQHERRHIEPSKQPTEYDRNTDAPETYKR